MTQLLAAALIAVFPIIMHYSFLWGEALLEEIATPWKRFDSLFNKWPLAFSIFGGVTLATAWLAWNQPAVAYPLVALGFLSLMFDLAGCFVSYMRRIEKR